MHRYNITSAYMANRTIAVPERAIDGRQGMSDSESREFKVRMRERLLGAEVRETAYSQTSTLALRCPSCSYGNSTTCHMGTRETSRSISPKCMYISWCAFVGDEYMVRQRVEGRSKGTTRKLCSRFCVSLLTRCLASPPILHPSARTAVSRCLMADTYEKDTHTTIHLSSPFEA